jgi:hypothetical protein
MSYLSNPLGALGFEVPPGKMINFYLLLACWSAAIVFLITAWVKVPGITQADNATFGKKQQDKIKEFITLNGWFSVFVLLTFFLLLSILFMVPRGTYLPL